MRTPLKRITIQGFKSIRNLENFELRNLNVLIGANGAGKSNFLSLFRLMSAMTRPYGLKSFVVKTGFPERYLFRGAETTRKISIKTTFNYGADVENGYEFDLVPNEEGYYFLIENEKIYSRNPAETHPFEQILESGTSIDPLLFDASNNPESEEKQNVCSQVKKAFSSLESYHFHDTSSTSGMRRMRQLVYPKKLDSQGEHLASFLYFLRDNHPQIYRKILKSVQIVLPFLEDFDVEPEANEGIMLKWRQKGVKNYTFGPSQLPDGGIRYICLVTALLQPNLPSTLIIDEPELGLHYEAIECLSGLIKSVSSQTQIILATQSPVLLDAFSPEDAIVVMREDGESTFTRLDKARLDKWLKEFSLGELWRLNIVDGGTNYE